MKTLPMILSAALAAGMLSPAPAQEKEKPKEDAGKEFEEKILDLLKRPGGATIKALMKASGWQPHSVRGFLSGNLRKKMGLVVVSAKSDDGERSYSIEG